MACGLQGLSLSETAASALLRGLNAKPSVEGKVSEVHGERQCLLPLVSLQLCPQDSLKELFQGEKKHAIPEEIWIHTKERRVLEMPIFM